MLCPGNIDPNTPPQDPTPRLHPMLYKMPCQATCEMYACAELEPHQTHISALRNTWKSTKTIISRQTLSLSRILSLGMTGVPYIQCIKLTVYLIFKYMALSGQARVYSTPREYTSTVLTFPFSYYFV